MSGFKSMIALVLAAGLWLGAAVAFAFASDFRSPTGHVWFTILCVGAVTSTVIYVGLAYASRTARDPDRPSQASPEPFPNAALESLITSSGPVELSDLAAGVYLEAILNPKDIFARISEHVTPNQRTISRRVTFTALLGPSESVLDGDPTEDGLPNVSAMDVVLPLIASPRGRLVDGLRVTEEGGKRVSTLPTAEQRVLLHAVVRYLAWLASDEALSGYIASGRELELWDAMTVGDRASIGQLAASIRKLLEAQDEDFAYGEQAEALILEVARYQHICVVVSAEAISARPWPHIFRFGLEHRLLGPVGNPPAPQAAWFDLLDDLRLAFGVRLNRLYFPVDLAFRARSYHLEVEGPEGTFLATQEVIQFPNNEQFGPEATNGSSEAASDDASYFSGYLQPLRGQRRGHLHVTDTTSSRRFGLAANFFERAPGTFASVLLASVSATVVIGIIAVRQIMGAAADPGVADGVLPALLAVPLGVTALAALDSSKTVRHPSLLARGLTFAVLALCLVTFVFSAVTRFTGVLSPSSWVLLVALSALTSVVAGITWMLRIAVERKIRRGSEPDNGRTEPGGPL